MTDELPRAIAYACKYSGASELSPEYAAVFLYRMACDLKKNIEAANHLIRTLRTECDEMKPVVEAAIAWQQAKKGGPPDAD